MNYALLFIDTPFRDFDLITLESKTIRGLLIKINKIRKKCSLKPMTSEELKKEYNSHVPDFLASAHPNCGAIPIRLDERQS